MAAGPLNFLEREFGGFGTGSATTAGCPRGRNSSFRFTDDSPVRVAVVGGGVAGSTIALGR